MMIAASCVDWAFFVDQVTHNAGPPCAVHGAAGRGLWNKRLLSGEAGLLLASAESRQKRWLALLGCGLVARSRRGKTSALRLGEFRQEWWTMRVFALAWRGAGGGGGGGGGILDCAHIRHIAV